jgi:NADH-quinone oxidoreductase subunit N
VSPADLVALLPLLILGGTSVLAMSVIAFRRSHLLIAAITAASLLGTLVSLWPAATASPRQVTDLLLVDRYALFFTGLVTAATLVIVLFSYRYFEKKDMRPEELYVLLLVATAGACVLVSASHFASFFLGLELLSVSLYALNAYLHTERLSLEAGLKYLVLAASSTAFLLFGMALMYAQLGTMSFAKMAHLADGAATDPLLMAGLALTLTGFGFKLGLVPFHLWTPDVYQGAPAPVTALVATVSKGAVFALLLRYFHGTGVGGGVFVGLSAVAVASMLFGNLLALFQDNVKRILAYSSIAHMGYVLVAFLAGGELAGQAVMFYLAAYFVTTLVALGVVTALSERDRDADLLSDYTGLFWRSPATAGVMAAAMLSLAGIPLTAGFLAKFYIVAAGASVAAWWLVIVLVVTSVLGLYYYLRVVVTLFSEESPVQSHRRISVGDGLLLAVLTLLLLWMGTYPGPFLNLVRSSIL